jgi:hypothetical protein
VAPSDPAGSVTRLATLATLSGRGIVALARLHVLETEPTLDA